MLNQSVKEVNRRQARERRNERGSATLIAVLIMGLLAVFVSLALSRTTSEALVMGNDAASWRSYNASEASLEMMTRNFSKIFDNKITPIQSDLNNIRDNTHRQNDWQDLFYGYTFDQQIFPNNPAQIVTTNATIQTGPFKGLKAIRDTWQLTSTAKGPSGAETQLSRWFYNNRLPIFQFGVFYDGDMFYTPGGTMYVGGRVHSNSHIYLRGNNLHFESAVTATGHIVDDTSRNGGAPIYERYVYVTNGAGSEEQVLHGSVNGGPDLTNNDPVHPDGTRNDTGVDKWSTFSQRFNGNLVAEAPKLKVPLQLGGADPVELIKRGRVDDNLILAASRYYNKSSIRITLDDRKDRLPGCAGVIARCGVRLDGDSSGLGLANQDGDLSRGYRPKPMVGPTYQATRVNGHRLYSTADANYPGGTGTTANYLGGTANRETWIKVELITYNTSNPTQPMAVDVTEDILSLGLTDERPPTGYNFFSPLELNPLLPMDRSIVKIQRYTIPGAPIKVADVAAATINTALATQLGGKPLYTYENNESFVKATAPLDNYRLPNEDKHKRKLKLVVTPTVTPEVIPIPIKMYDAREGVYNDNLTAADWNAIYTANGSNDNVPMRGVMSLVEIDMNNLRRFMNGEFDNKFPSTTNYPAGLKSYNVPLEERGLILYVSDRRGDADNDGVYDMENILVPNAADTQTGTLLTDNSNLIEDVFGGGNGGQKPDGLLQTDYLWESCSYSINRPADYAALFDHKYYRRAVRLVNGQQLPGNATRGVTVASENGAYILGNYNSSGAVAPIGNRPTPTGGYLPTVGTVPASVVADGITVLSRAWNDGKSFRNPHKVNNDKNNGTLGAHGRMVPNGLETTVRAALLMGSTRSGVSGITNPGTGGHVALANTDGGVMNFPRFLEHWTDSNTGVITRFNYLGSLVSLFKSRNANGSFKFGNSTTYSAPDRNWNFDTNFEDPTRIPPGTPFLQYVQVTGFRKVNN